MTEKQTVLAVDDSAMNHKILKKVLDESFLVQKALSGRECIDLVEDKVPDLILLDVTMPDMDGYETCTALRGNVSTKDVPILFLSGRCSVEEKLKGYEVGGDDYITKPFDSQELLIKIKKTLKHKEGVERLTKKAKTATTVAITALKDNSNITLCLKFLQDTCRYDTIEGLVKRLFESVGELGLSSTVQVRIPGGDIHNFFDDGVERELESALLTKVNAKGHFVEFGKRMVINTQKFSILIKNMPHDHKDTGGALKDYLSTLLEGANSRLANILSHQNLKQQRDILTKVLARMGKTLLSSEEHFTELMNQGTKTFQQFIGELEKVIGELDMAEYQEKAIFELVNKTEKLIAELNVSLLQEDERFHKLVEDLGKIDLG